MLYHLASHLSTLGERESEESESEEGDASEFEPLAKRSTRIGHHALKFCRIEIQTKDYKASSSIFSFPFQIQEKNCWSPLCLMSFLL